MKPGFFAAASKPKLPARQWRAAPTAARRKQGKAAAPATALTEQQRELQTCVEEAHELCSRADPMVRDLADMLDDLLEDGAGRLDAAAAAMDCAAQTQFLTAAVDKLKLRMARTCMHALQVAEQVTNDKLSPGAAFTAGLQSVIDSLFVGVVEGWLEDVDLVRPQGPAQTTTQATAAPNTATVQAAVTLTDAATSPPPSPPRPPHAAQPSASSGSASPGPAESSKQQQSRTYPPSDIILRGGQDPAAQQQAPTAEPAAAADSKREQQQGGGKRRRRRGRRGGKKVQARRQAQQQRQTSAPTSGQRPGRQTHRSEELELCAILGRGFNAMTEVFAAVLATGRRPEAQHAQTAPPTNGGQQEQQQQRPTPQPSQTRQQHAPSGQEAAQPSAARPSSEEGRAAQQLAGCKRRDRPESQSPVAERNVLAALANAAA